MKATKKSYRLQVQLAKQLIYAMDTVGENIEDPEALSRGLLAADMLKNCADNYKAAITNYSDSLSEVK